MLPDGSQRSAVRMNRSRSRLLALDARNRLRREVVVSVGCLTASLVHPREVFQEAVVSRAAALVLFHNHPSGDPEPSVEDLALTRRLVAAGSLMGILMRWLPLAMTLDMSAE